jgi:hypothetical protein
MEAFAFVLIGAMSTTWPSEERMRNLVERSLKWKTDIYH